MKVLFVCLGNICRSPAAENIFRHLINKAGVQDKFTIDSAGTEAWHTGKAPDARMTQTLLDRNIPVSSTARQITLSDLASFDLILTMDDDNFSNVRKLDPDGLFTYKIKKFCSLTTEHQQTEVPDPYYGGQDGFDLVADILIDGCSTLLNQHTITD